MAENSERGQFPAKRADFQAKIKEMLSSFNNTLARASTFSDK